MNSVNQTILKKLSILIVLFAITIYAEAQIKVISNGNVGVGTNNPTQKLHVTGDARFVPGWVGLTVGWSPNNYCPAIFTDYNNYMWIGRSDRWANHIWSYAIDYQNLYKSSDVRLKENIEICSSVLPKIKQIQIYTFNYNDIYFKDFTPEQKEEMQRKEFGVIAQELEQIFPELVYTPNSLREYYSVDYTSMIPILVEAIKEQQIQIESLQKMLSEQITEAMLLKKQFETHNQNDLQYIPSSNMQTSENFIQNESGKLFQNIPNPFSLNTEIKFEVPTSSTSARLLIHDMQGVEIKSYSITTKGVGNIIIQGSELQAGMYMYTLLVNNTIVDSKRMILTK